MESSFADIKPTITANITNQFFMTIKELQVDERCQEELMRMVKEQDLLLEESDALKMLCEAKELEKYNRRDNVKIIELPEITGIDSDDHPIFKSCNQTAEKVLELSDDMSAGAEKYNISIAHLQQTSNCNQKLTC